MRPGRAAGHSQNLVELKLRGESGRLEIDPPGLVRGGLSSGPDPVGEWCVHRQPPGLYLDHARDFRKLRELLVLDPFE